MNNNFFIALIFTLLFSACGNKVLYEKSVSLSNNIWDKESPVVFSMEHNDTTSIVDIGMTFKHTDEYAYSNLWLFLEVSGPDGMIRKDTLEMFLAHRDGRWLGKKKSETVEISATYQKGVKFSKPGIYSFSVVQGMRINKLEGIKEVSFWVQDRELPDK